MGADLLERFRQAGLEAAGQHRNVTVLFVDLSGYTQLSQRLDNEILFEIIQQFIQVLANDVYKYEGMVDKFTGDGLMALFGAPIAHENNAELAVRAALDMQTSVAALSQQLHERLGTDLRLHIGLHSGPVIVGGIGSNLLMNYTAIGDTVNLARRLEDAASPGTILVSETVYRQTRALFDYVPAPGLSLKGVTEPVSGYRVTGTKTRPGSVRGIESLHAPMIGRDPEFERLRQTAHALLHNRQGRFVLITGEAGIGKSRLVSELKSYVRDKDITVVEGQSLTYRRLAAYWMFLDALRKFLGVNPDTPEIQIRERLEARVSKAMGERASHVLPYLEHLLSLSPSNQTAAERLRFLDAGQLRQQIFLSVRDLFLAEAHQKPLILIFEDLHWADQSSLDLLLFLLDSIRHAALMIVAISRPIQEGTMVKIVEWAGQNQPDQFCQLPLHSLSIDQSEQLLFQLLSISELPPALREHILQRAAGIPFYLEEILRMLIDNGMIQPENGHWRISPGADIASLGVPETLEGLILARFDRLDETQRRLLQVASVIGREFSLPVLQAVLQSLDEKRLIAVLASLTERDFIYPQPDSPHTEYIFKHALMSDAIYKTMLRRDRSDLHGQIGEAIEQVYSHRLEGQIEILARHFSWSPRHERALHYLILAGQKAARNYDNEHARENFNQALELLPQVGHTPLHELQVYTGLGDVLVFTGEYSGGRENYLKALAAVSPEEREQYAVEKSNLHRKIGITHERQGDYDQALLCLGKSESALVHAPSDMPLEKAEIINDIGWTYFRKGNVDEAEKNLTHALTLVEDSGRLDIVASIYNRLGGVYFEKDQLDQAGNYVRKSLVIREEMGDAVGAARSCSNLGLLAWRRGDWDRGLDFFTRSLELHARVGDVEGAINLKNNIGLLLTDKGELEEARTYLEEGLQEALQIGHSFLVGMGYHHLSRNRVTAKEWNKSLEFGNQALEVFSEIGAKENLISVYISVGEAWLGASDVEEAKRAGETALKLLEESGIKLETPTNEYGRICHLMGKIALIEGDIESAGQNLRNSATQFSLVGNQLELGRALVSMAVLAQARSDRSAFRRHLNEARMIFLQLGANLDLETVDHLSTDSVYRTPG